MIATNLGRRVSWHEYGHDFHGWEMVTYWGSPIQFGEFRSLVLIDGESIPVIVERNRLKFESEYCEHTAETGKKELSRPAN